MATEILLIDKDKGHAEALGVYLERQQFEVYKAGSPDDVLMLFDNLSVEIVLADPGLPDTDTVHLLKQIKKSHPGVQLIIMSADEQLDQAMDLLKQDVVHYLRKPVKSAALDLAVKQARTWIAMNKKVARYEKKFKDLRNAQNLYQQLFDEVPCYISVQDREFRLTATNRMFKRDFGDEIGSYCYEVYKHRGSPCRNCPVAATFEDGLPHPTEEIVTSKSGKQYNVLTWTAPIRNSLGQVTQVMEMSTNITRLRQLQDHLTSLGLMIGSMSHGVKGMLTALDGGVYQLETGLARNDEQRTSKAFGQVKQMTGRIRNMVLEILYYAKSRELSYEPVDISKMVEKVLNNAKAIADKNGINLEASIANDLGAIEVDPNWMQAALVNFMENAVDACTYDRSKEDHAVKLDVFDPGGDRICFVIQDNGMGMDQETREKMFTLFFTSKGSQGTGLGLFIANRVIHQHGGTIKVESELQKGTRFKISLPRQKPEQPLRTDKPEKWANGLLDDSGKGST
ncbi:MAG: response regulator [Deltaproteobacteria bacterium]|nr:response regulator [Deltaproteobacteria bacterium]